MLVPRPSDVFDRDHEWEALSEFATSPRLPRLGIVSGRRRQGKSFLLRRLCAHAGVRGVYVLAQEQTRQVALQRFVAAMAAHLGIPESIQFPGWDEALRFFMQQLAAASGGPKPPLLVIDEFPYLLQHSPELPSVVQSLYDDARNDATAPGMRLILCGSALSVMTELLSGQKPLRGRAVLDLGLRPFTYRDAARFWNIDDPAVAFEVHAVFGGTPGYRDLVEEPPPGDVEGLPRWLGRTFQPARALLTEVDYLLREDPRITDRALYQSMLSAISLGAGTPAKIGGVLGRSDRSLSHPLTVLESAGFIHRSGDVLKQRGSRWTVTDPIVRFHEAVLLPRRTEFEEHRGEQAVRAARATISSQVLGPHFEELCREWTARFAAQEGLGRMVGPIGSTTISDPRGRTGYEVDVVALAEGEVAGRHDARIALIGEAKSTNRPRSLADLNRLDHIRGLLADRGARATGATLALFSRSGFDSALSRAAAERHDVLLIDLPRLYGRHR
jgi:AAA+ ATPase superfamily predicted ATPase